MLKERISWCEQPPIVAFPPSMFPSADVPSADVVIRQELRREDNHIEQFGVIGLAVFEPEPQLLPDFLNVPVEVRPFDEILAHSELNPEVVSTDVVPQAVIIFEGLSRRFNGNVTASGIAEECLDVP